MTRKALHVGGAFLLSTCAREPMSKPRVPSTLLNPRCEQEDRTLKVPSTYTATLPETSFCGICLSFTLSSSCSLLSWSKIVAPPQSCSSSHSPALSLTPSSSYSSSSSVTLSANSISKTLRSNYCRHCTISLLLEEIRRMILSTSHSLNIARKRVATDISNYLSNHWRASRDFLDKSGSSLHARQAWECGWGRDLPESAKVFYNDTWSFDLTALRSCGQPAVRWKTACRDHMSQDQPDCKRRFSQRVRMSDFVRVEKQGF